MAGSELSDEQLIPEIIAKDKELYAIIVQRYQTKLFHYLHKFVKNPDELEDVLQTVFIKTYHNLNGFDQKRKFSSWIYRIAHNEAINYIKKESRSISIEEEEMEIVDKEIDIKDAIDSSLLKSKIEASLAMIHNKYREPLILYYFEQKTYDEISDILQIPRNTVGVRIMRGKTLLKEFFNQAQYGQ